MSIMFMSTTVREGGGDIYITNAPVGASRICKNTPFVHIHCLRHVSAVLHH